MSATQSAATKLLVAAAARTGAVSRAGTDANLSPAGECASRAASGPAKSGRTTPPPIRSRHVVVRRHHGESASGFKIRRRVLGMVQGRREGVCPPSLSIWIINSSSVRAGRDKEYLLNAAARAVSSPRNSSQHSSSSILNSLLSICNGRRRRTFPWGAPRAAASWGCSCACRVTVC